MDRRLGCVQVLGIVDAAAMNMPYNLEGSNWEWLLDEDGVGRVTGSSARDVLGFVPAEGGGVSTWETRGQGARQRESG